MNTVRFTILLYAIFRFKNNKKWESSDFDFHINFVDKYLKICFEKELTGRNFDLEISKDRIWKSTQLILCKKQNLNPGDQRNSKRCWFRTLGDTLTLGHKVVSILGWSSFEVLFVFFAVYVVHGPSVNFLLFKVQDLQVMRHTFEDVRVTGTFMLKSLIVKKTTSMACLHQRS